MLRRSHSRIDNNVSLFQIDGDFVDFAGELAACTVVVLRHRGFLEWIRRPKWHFSH